MVDYQFDGSKKDDYDKHIFARESFSSRLFIVRFFPMLWKAYKWKDLFIVWASLVDEFNFMIF